MAKRRTLELSSKGRTELEQLLARSPKPYLRERASALLKIADGVSPNAVAHKGLLMRRAPDTVYEWLDRYEAEGVAGLKIRSGRGRKPAFSP